MGITNGWDAVCALDAQRVNDIFFQQYLQDGPTRPETALRTILQGEGASYLLLDVVPGPPEVTFPGNLGLQQVQFTMFLLGGSLVAFDANQQVITSAISLEPNRSSLTGPVSLAQVKGSSFGQVVLDLGTGAYTPQFEGIDPDSVLSHDIGAALQTFFADNETKYLLGKIWEKGLPACLLPTSFDIVTQPAPDGGGGGCVLLLIQTNGSPGVVGQLDPYPMPSGRTVALVVSSRVIFDGLLPIGLTEVFGKVGTTFAGSQVNGAWQTVGNGGAFNIGRISGESDLTSYWTQDDKGGDETPVVLQVSGFDASAQTGPLSVSWDHTWTQGWGYQPPGSRYSHGWLPIEMEVKYSLTATAVVDSATGKVSFSGSATPAVTYTDPNSGWDSVFGGSDEAEAAGDLMCNALKAILDPFFGAFTLPYVETFALANLLFPNSHKISLQDASLPADLVLTGQMAQPLTITPPTVELAPGQTQQFAATGKVSWQIDPATTGSITKSGLYTAPPSLEQPGVVVVTATLCSDGSVCGSSMIVVAPPTDATALVVSPAMLMLTEGQSFGLVVADSTRTAVDADCSLSPAVGQLSSGLMTGQWTYAAPLDISSATVVTLTAKSRSNPNQTGSASIQLLPAAKITITPADPSVAAGKTLALSTSPSDLETYGWQTYPPGVGSVASDDSDHSQATYTAPSAVSQNTEVIVVVYSLETAALGLTRITVLASA